ncbi:hypothetical protein [Chromobacterium paludis]|uniref:Uncharacterized protein n=1 Tax=Chromobacterium paludis TaxID=2605945 RepID=A0A5C1DHY4_9NEIS|nr:hypothetical protein [Chromobacterium paludis]QEL55569.1 hypothetical protein FYK34_08290 [Chromobacterium paludis]
MPTDSRSRIHIEQPGKPRLYQLSDLPGYQMVGVIHQGNRTGALVRHTASGVYGMAYRNEVRPLDQRRVKAALGIPNGAGAPPKLQGGSRKNVYLDTASIEIARKLGHGNLSEGIRKALKLAA